MRCEACNKKCIPINCSYCIHDYCSSCIQLEIHKCSGLTKKCKNLVENLEKSLIRVIPKKHNFTY